jgi:hypothetical protein
MRIVVWTECPSAVMLSISPSSFFLLYTLPLFTRTLQVLIFSPSPYDKALIPLVRAIKL